MDKLIQMYESRPIALSIVSVLILCMVFMILVWRRDAEYLTMKRKECPKEHLLKRDLFNFSGWAAALLAIVSSLNKF
jgi:hypothetical protein